MLWSYAASVHLELPNDVVFHPNGYKGSSQWLIENYTQQNYIGLPFLEWCGLTASNKNDQNGIVFPQMKQWLRDYRITSYNVCYTKLLRKGKVIT